MPRFWASFISTLSIFFIIILPAFAIATAIVHESIGIAQSIGTVQLEKLMTHAHSFAGQLGIDLDKMLIDAAQRIASQTGLLASHVIGNIWKLFIGIIIALLAIFFFFRDGENVLNLIVHIFPANHEMSEKVIKDIGIMIKSNIAASLLAATIQGTAGGLAFAWLDFSAPVLWGAVMGFFSVFPFVGAWVVWIPTAIGLIIDGRNLDAIILITIGLVLVHPVDNILRPAVVAKTTHLNGLLILISLLGGVQAFGAAGLLIGPVLVIFAAMLVKLPNLL